MTVFVGVTNQPRGAGAAQVLFISGTRDPFMGDFRLLESTLKKSKLRHSTAGTSEDLESRELFVAQLPIFGAKVKVQGGDHGLKCPKSKEDDAVAVIEEAIRAFIKSAL